MPGAPPLGPPTVQPGGPDLYSGALGPLATARAARWARGITGFSLNLDVDEITKPVADREERLDRVEPIPLCEIGVGSNDSGAVGCHQPRSPFGAGLMFGAGPSHSTFERPWPSMPVTTRRMLRMVSHFFASSSSR